MGGRTQVLLVSRRSLLAGATGLVVAGCGEKTGGRVVARDYDAFFLWPGVSPADWLGRAREVYILAGEVRHHPHSRFLPLRATPKVSGPALWLVVRVERLDWDEAVYQAVFHGIGLWETAGNRVHGLQIDFDSATRGLSNYAVFLSGLRARLARRWKLSITGLMDWSANGDEGALVKLADCIDELVVQTYQGRQTIAGYERYLGSLARAGMPYRLGLVEGGEWREPVGLHADPNFRGYVVFLLGVN